jgi:hypothetical protein
MSAAAPAAFTGEKARVLGFGILPSRFGGIIVRCYGTPAFFLQERGFIRVIERAGVPGTWYTLTDKGQTA